MSIRKMIGLHPRRRRATSTSRSAMPCISDVLREDVPELRRRLRGRGHGHAPVHPPVPRLRRRLRRDRQARGCAGPGSNEQVLREMLELCARVCEECAAECERHDHEHCKLCAQMCRECAEDCRKAADGRSAPIARLPEAGALDDARGLRGSRPCCVFPPLGELLEHHVALQAREMVDEQHAVQMVHLVLEADREQAVDLFLVGLAVRHPASWRGFCRGASTSAYCSGTDRQPSV